MTNAIEFQSIVNNLKHKLSTWTEQILSHHPGIDHLQLDLLQESDQFPQVFHLKHSKIVDSEIASAAGQNGKNSSKENTTSQPFFRHNFANCSSIKRHVNIKDFQDESTACVHNPLPRSKSMWESIKQDLGKDDPYQSKQQQWPFHRNNDHHAELNYFLND